MVSPEEIQMKAPPGTVRTVPGSEFVVILAPAIPAILRSFGCDSVPSTEPPGGRVFRCQICGPRPRTTPCDGALHDAYYAALEAGEREPIEWEGDIRHA